MKRHHTILFLLALILCLTAVATLLALPERTPHYLTIPWWTVDSGSRTSSGGAFRLSGTTGQSDVGSMTGGPFILTSGFWNRETGGISGGETGQVYLPYVSK